MATYSKVRIGFAFILLLGLALTAGCGSTAPPLILQPTALQLTLTPSPSPTEVVITAMVNVRSLNLREGPGTGYGIRGSLIEGEELVVLGRNQLSTWLKIRTVDKLVGWVAVNLVTIEVQLEALPIVQ